MTSWSGVEIMSEFSSFKWNGFSGQGQEGRRSWIAYLVVTKQSVNPGYIKQMHQTRAKHGFRMGC